MRSFKINGIIVKRVNYKDADRILTVFTKEQGKISIKAAGIRRIPSRRSPHVELLNHSLLTLYRGNAFPVLTEAQTFDSFSSLKQDLSKIGFAYHICELIDGLCPEGQENVAVFELLKNTLTRLSQPVILERSANGAIESLSEDFIVAYQPLQDDIVSIIHEFEVELLNLLGYWNNNRAVLNWDTHAFIENIIERKLKSRNIFAKLQ